jgi:hypothetical protein
MFKALLVALVIGGALVWNVPAASAQRGQCLSSTSGMDLVMNDNGFDVLATAALDVPERTPVSAELRKVTQTGPETVVASGTADNSGRGILAYSTWVARDSLGNPGDIVSLYAYFDAPGQPLTRTCSILRVRI